MKSIGPVIALVTTATLVTASTDALAEPTFESDQVVDGTCDQSSHIAMGKVGADVTKQQARFYCASATITNYYSDTSAFLRCSLKKKVLQYARSCTAKLLTLIIAPPPAVIEPAKSFVESMIIEDRWPCREMTLDGRAPVGEPVQSTAANVPSPMLIVML
jgi:hypothetical protein